jgi:RNA polymerase sigma factor (TIGR02999 family)
VRQHHVQVGEVTRLLEAARKGDADALPQVFALTYQELHSLAHAKLQRSGRLTVLDTTALVHECYLRLTQLERFEVRDHAHFICYAARAMRSIAVDHARKRQAQRRGCAEPASQINEEALRVATDENELLRLNDALEELGSVDARLAQVVELKYFVGLSLEQIGEALGINERTARRDWEKARTLLFGALQA